MWDVREGGLDAAPPASAGELRRHALATKTPFTLRFAEEDRGKTVWMALAWQNGGGALGALSAYRAAVVP